MFNHNEVNSGYIDLNHGSESLVHSTFEIPDEQQFIPEKVTIIDEGQHYIITVRNTEGKAEFIRISKTIQDSTEEVADLLAA